MTATGKGPQLLGPSADGTLRVSADSLHAVIDEADALHAVINEIGYPVVLMTADGTVIQQNEATQAAIGDDAGATSGPGRFCPFLHEADGTRAVPSFIDMVIKTGLRQEREIERFGRWWRIHLVPLRNQKRDVHCLLLLAEDISSLKAEQQVELEREKALTRTLVREVHHRIKNHLQGLIGLLRVNSGSWQSVREAIDDAIVQIQSIAIVHGLLARDGGPSIGFSRLIEQICATAKLGSRIPVRCVVSSSRCDMVTIPEEEAVSLALVIGELLTNAVKHTQMTRDSRITWYLSCPDDSVELTISNYPAQLPVDFSLDRSVNTGLDLVKALLPRDRATLTIAQCGDEVTTRLRLKPIVASKECSTSAAPR